MGQDSLVLCVMQLKNWSLHSSQQQAHRKGPTIYPASVLPLFHRPFKAINKREDFPHFSGFLNLWCSLA